MSFDNDPISHKYSIPQSKPILGAEQSLAFPDLSKKLYAQLVLMVHMGSSKLIVSTSVLVRILSLAAATGALAGIILLAAMWISAKQPAAEITLGAVCLVVVLALCLIGGFGMRISVERQDQSITLRAPLYRRSFTAGQVSNIQVGEDPGANPGWINWPVLGRAAAPAGIRINVGGSAKVAFTLDDGERFTIVVADGSQAKELAALLSA